MNEYDFSKLNDKDFELLTVDLIAKLEGTRIERFKPGKDSGVDGRFFSSDGAEIIIQCKHWLKSGLARLIRELKSKEAYKVKKLKPERYVFVTSLELSRENKKAIQDIFSPFIKSQSDIYGSEDLNDLISEHRDIELKHYKLWLSSTNVFNAILNSAVVGRSEYKLDEIKDFSKKYVVTAMHEVALEKLEELHSLIITGEPGIGKTTLAEHLCLHYVIKGYELCCIEESIPEAEGIFQKGRKQIFYFDDFLGRNFLLALCRNEDSKIINFIKRVSKDKDKRFILTTRSTILNQGKRLSELFSIENINRNEHELSINKLSTLDKAKILYNHIWFGNLGEEYVENLYVDKRYLDVIHDDNYSPRLVAFVTDAQKLHNIEPQNYWQHIEDSLDDPSEIWGHVYDRQLDEYGRFLTSTVSFNGTNISEQDLESSFLYRVNKKETKYGNSDFKAIAKFATGSVINRKLYEKGEAYYDLFNPALGDFLLRKYSKDENALYLVFESLHTKNSLFNLRSLLAGHVVDVEVLKKVITRLMEDCLNTEWSVKTIAYKIEVINLVIDHISLKQVDKNLIKNWISLLCQNLSQIDEVTPFLILLKKLLNSNILELKNLPSLSEFLGASFTTDLIHEDYLARCEIISSLDEEGKSELESEFHQAALEYWFYQIDDDIDDNGLLYGLYLDEDRDEASERVRDHVRSLLNEYSICFSEEDVFYISEGCDVRMHIDHNYQSWKESENPSKQASHIALVPVNEDEDIEDLFDRTL